MTRTFVVPLLFAAGCLVSGCAEPGPVELVDDGSQDRIEVVAPPPAPMPGMEFGDADSAGIVPASSGRFLGHFLVAGARFDAPGATAEASLARAILFDRSSPVQVGPGRTAFGTLDAGIVALDATPLWKVEKRVRIPGGDTLLGVQYVLFNRLLGGFRYEGGRTYAWAGTGSGAILPFAREIAAPPEIVVESFAGSAGIPVDRPLRVRWSGGGAAVQLVISMAGDTRIDARPILHLRLGRNAGGIVIPAAILALLPKDRGQFVFTFYSRNVSAASLPGYQDEILLEAVTSHSLAVNVRR